MPNNIFITEILKRFSPEDVKSLAYSLSHDAMLWGEVNGQSIWGKFETGTGLKFSDFRPGCLALFALGMDHNAEQLSKLPLVTLPKNTRLSAIELFEETIQSQREPVSLAEAGLLALALRERRRVVHSWEGLTAELKQPLNGQPINSAVWKTPFACLFSLVPDGMEVLKKLARDDDWGQLFPIAAHVLLSNPMSEAERIAFFKELLLEISLEIQVEWLRQLRLNGEKPLVQQLANELIEILQKQAGEKTPEKKYTIQQKANRIHELESLVCLYQYANRADLFHGAVKELRENLNDVHGLLDIKVFEAKALSGGDSGEALKDAKTIQHASRAKESAPEVAFLLSGVLEGEDFSFEDETGENAVLKSLARVKQLARKGCSDAEKIEAAGEIEAALERIEKDDLNSFLHITSEWDAAGFVDALNALDLGEAARRSGELLQRKRPADLELIGALSKTHEKLGNFDDAISYAGLAVALKPDAPELHRSIAQLWEKKGDWLKAFDERSRILQLVDTPLPTDWLRYGKTAAKSNQPHHAVEAYQKVLDLDNENADAHLLMAEALLDLGQPGDAIEHLERPSLLVEDMPESWLLLSKAYFMTGKKEKGKEILKLGVSALPNCAELNNALAKAIVNDGNPEDAIPYFQKAKELDPESDQMLLDLGRTLRNSGRQEEAISLFADAIQKWPDNIQIGYLYAESLIDLGRGQEALPILETVLENGDRSFEKLMLYVDVLTGCERGHSGQNIPDAQVAKALEAVNSALEINPDSVKAKIIQAELLGRSGNGKDALAVYRSVNNEMILDRMDKELEGRFFSGYGLAAFDEGDFSLAIHQLEKALACDPEQHSLLQRLAEAYLANNQIEEGVRIAKRAFEAFPGNLANAAWFVEKAKLVEDFEAAEEALRQAGELNPDEPEVWLMLAEFHNEMGDKPKTKEALDKILTIENAGVQTLRKAARLFYEVCDVTLALVCLEKALHSDGEKVPAVFIEAAGANVAAGNLEIALQILQGAAESFPQECRFNVFASDILGFLGRSTMAMSCLENALGVVENETTVFDNNQQVFALPLDIPEQWFASLSNPSYILLRYGLYLRTAGDLASAKTHLQKALELEPGNMVLRYALADLDQALLDFDEAEDLSDCSLIMPSYRENIPLTSPVASWRKNVFVNINCLHAEIALLRNMEETARQVYKNLKESMIESPRIDVLGSRFLLRDGQITNAGELFEDAFAANSKDDAGTALFSSGWPFFEPVEFILADNECWLAQAALDLRQWDVAKERGGLLVERYPEEALNQYLYAKILVTRAEYSRLGEELGCVQHCPGPDALDAEVFELFEKAIQKAKTTAGTENAEIERLRVRGQAVFRPTEQNIQSFREMAKEPEETAVLMMLLRQRELIDEAIQEAGKYPAATAIQTQLALSLSGEDAKKGHGAAEKASELSLTDPLSLTAYSFLAETNEDYVLAYQLADKALGAWPDEPVWHARAAILADMIGLHEMRNTHWKAACALEPRKVNYLTGFGESLFQSGMVSEAAHQFLKAKDIEPENETVLNLLSKAFIKQNQLERALDCCEQVLGKNPENLDAIMMAGQTALKMHNLDKAFEHAKNFVKLDPRNPRALLLLSSTLVDQGKMEDALTVLEHAVDLIGPDLNVLFERAQLIQKIDGSSSALPYLEDLARLDPENIDVLCQLAKVQMECKQYSEADDTLHQALRISPDSPELNLMIGRLQKAQGQLDKALHYLSEAVRTSPVEVEPYLELANAYQERREYQQALRLYQKAIKMAPADDRAYYQSAIVMREIKDFQGAEAMLRKAAQLSPNDLSIRRQLSAVIALNLVHHASEVNIQL